MAIRRKYVGKAGAKETARFTKAGVNLPVPCLHRLVLLLAYRGDSDLLPLAAQYGTRNAVSATWFRRV